MCKSVTLLRLIKRYGGFYISQPMNGDNHINGITYNMYIIVSDSSKYSKMLVYNQTKSRAICQTYNYIVGHRCKFC